MHPCTHENHPHLFYLVRKTKQTCITDFFTRRQPESSPAPEPPATASDAPPDVDTTVATADTPVPHGYNTRHRGLRRTAPKRSRRKPRQSRSTPPSYRHRYRTRNNRTPTPPPTLTRSPTRRRHARGARTRHKPPDTHPDYHHGHNTRQNRRRRPPPELSVIIILNSPLCLTKK